MHKLHPTGYITKDRRLEVDLPDGPPADKVCVTIATNMNPATTNYDYYDNVRLEI